MLNLCTENCELFFSGHGIHAALPHSCMILILSIMWTKNKFREKSRYSVNKKQPSVNLCNRHLLKQFTSFKQVHINNKIKVKTTVERTRLRIGSHVGGVQSTEWTMSECRRTRCDLIALFLLYDICWTLVTEGLHHAADVVEVDIQLMMLYQHCAVIQQAICFVTTPSGM